MKKPSQEELYGPLLTDDVQYRHDIVQVSPLDPQREQDLFARARAGDTEARNEIITHGLLHYIEYWAKRLFVTYAYMSYRIEYADLIQAASLTVLEYFDHALTLDNPLAYLFACAKYQMRTYCIRYSSLIATPTTFKDGKQVSPRPVESLDAPLNEEMDGTLAEILADETWQCRANGDEKACERLYQALSHLTEKQRILLMRVFGLGDYPQETITEIQHDLKVAEMSVRQPIKRGLKNLEQLLASETQEYYTCPQACERLGVSSDALRSMMRDYDMQTVTKNRYKQSDIEALAQKREACLATGYKILRRKTLSVA